MKEQEHRRPKPGAFDCVCGADLERNERFDAYYCIDSMEWVETACSDADCYYCSKRPTNAEGLTNETKEET